MSESERPKPPPELDAAHPHDALFKFTFSRPEHVEAELRCILPANVAALLDFTAIEAVSGTFADRELRGLQSDLLLKLRLAGAPRQYAFVHLIFEHQSSHDPWLPLRLLRYKLRVLERAQLEAPNERQLPPVLAVVLYHGDRPLPVPWRFSSLYTLSDEQRENLGGHLLDFEIVADDLTRQSSSQLARRVHVSAFVRLALLLLQRARVSQDLLAEMREWLELLQELEADRPRMGDSEALFWYAFRVANVLPSQVRDMLESSRLPNLRDVAMTTAERLIQQGRVEGEAKGRAEGEAKGRADILRKLLQLRFGELPAAVSARIDAAVEHGDTAALDRWAERVLSAKDAAETVEA